MTEMTIVHVDDGRGLGNPACGAAPPEHGPVYKSAERALQARGLGEGCLRDLSLGTPCTMCLATLAKGSS